jgi:hypothetical protein
MNKADFADYIKCLKAHDFPGLSKHYTPDVKGYFFGQPAVGLDGIIAMERQLMDQADWTMNVLRVIMDEGGIAAEITMDLTFRKDAQTPLGPMKKGDRRHVHFCQLYGLRDGRICELRGPAMLA